MDQTALRINMRSDWRKILILTGVIVLLSVSCMTWKRWYDYPALKNEEKTELTRMTIESVLEKKEIPFYSILCDTTVIVMLSSFMPAECSIKETQMPRIHGIKWVCLTDAQIEERANRLGSFKALEFMFNLIGWDITHVYLKAWTIFPTSYYDDMKYLKPQFDEITVRFHREEDKWILDAMKRRKTEIEY
jgi:hypothetical protein